MLNYTLKSLSKTGFFISKKNDFLNDNMVSYLFCSRNSVFFIDIIYYIINLRKILYFFRNGVSLRMKFLILLENTVFKEIASKYIKTLFENVKRNFVYNTRKFFCNSKRIQNKEVMLSRKILFSNKFRILIEDSNAKIYPLFLKRIKKFKKRNFFFKKIIKNRKAFSRKGSVYKIKRKAVVNTKLYIKANYKILKYINLLFMRAKSFKFLIRKYEFIFSKKLKRKIKFLIRNISYLKKNMNMIRKKKANQKRMVVDASFFNNIKVVKGFVNERKLFFRKHNKRYSRNKSVRKRLNYIYFLKRKIYSRTDYKVKQLNILKKNINKIGLEKVTSSWKMFEENYVYDFVFFYFLFYKVKAKDQKNNILKKGSQRMYSFYHSKNLMYKKFLSVKMIKQVNFIKRRFFDVYKRGNFLLFKEKKKLKNLNIRNKFFIKRKLREYKAYNVKLLKFRRMKLKVFSLKVLDNFKKIIQKKEQKLRGELLKISDSIFWRLRKKKASKVRILYLSKVIMHFNKMFCRTQQSKTIFYKLMNINSFSNFFYEYKSKFFKRNFHLWSDSWLQGGLSNFNGLKRTFKGKNRSFRRLRTLPDFFVLLSADSKEEVVREIHSLKLPLLGVSDLGDNPYFFNYMVLSNTGSQSLLFFYFCLLLEATFRGYIFETKKFLS